MLSKHVPNLCTLLYSILFSSFPYCSSLPLFLLSFHLLIVPPSFSPSIHPPSLCFPALFPCVPVSMAFSECGWTAVATPRKLIQSFEVLFWIHLVKAPFWGRYTVLCSGVCEKHSCAQQQCEPKGIQSKSECIDWSQHVWTSTCLCKPLVHQSLYNQHVKAIKSDQLRWPPVSQHPELRNLSQRQWGGKNLCLKLILGI